MRRSRTRVSEDALGSDSTRFAVSFHLIGLLVLLVIEAKLQVLRDARACRRLRLRCRRSGSVLVSVAATVVAAEARALSRCS